MKWLDDSKILELTLRNIAALTAKLSDPKSARMLNSGDGGATVFAVEVADPEKTAAAAAEGVVTLTRAELAALATVGTTIEVAGITVLSVADEAHYSTRPAGAVFMPTAGTVDGPDMTHWRLRHVCEVCGRDEIHTPAEAFAQGWDYPPRMGSFGVISPRTCGSCSISETVWWAITTKGGAVDDLTDAQKDVVARILSEPMSIEVSEP